jgi:hypothetical protein
VSSRAADRWRVKENDVTRTDGEEADFAIDLGRHDRDHRRFVGAPHDVAIRWRHPCGRNPDSPTEMSAGITPGRRG